MYYSYSTNQIGILFSMEGGGGGGGGGGLDQYPVLKLFHSQVFIALMSISRAGFRSLSVQ